MPGISLFVWDHRPKLVDDLGESGAPRSLSIFLSVPPFLIFHFSPFLRNKWMNVTGNNFTLISAFHPPNDMVLFSISIA